MNFVENYSMKDVEFLFKAATYFERPYVGMLVKMEGFPKEEIIINPVENADAKIEYYKKTYDEDLQHKFSPGISITKVAIGTLEEVEKELLGCPFCEAFETSSLFECGRHPKTRIVTCHACQGKGVYFNIFGFKKRCKHCNGKVKVN